MQNVYSLKIAAWTVIVILFMWEFHLSRRRGELQTFSDSLTSHVSSKIPFFGNKSPFVELPLETPDNLAPLAELCAIVEWVPDRIWQCDHVSGGLSNVYNLVLHCVRIAIEAGASAFIPPMVWTRSIVDPILLITGNETDLTDLSYLFDYTHFKTSLADACPQLKIYDSPWSVPRMPKDPRYVGLHPQDLGEPETFRTNLDNHLAGIKIWAGGPYYLPAYNYIVQYTQYFWWHTYGDKEQPGLANTLQSILHFREDARSLAAAVLADMQHTFSKESASTGDEGRIKFFGAHLRTGKDLDPEWAGTGRDQQFDDYMRSVSNNSFELMYLASGAPLDTEYFIDRAGTEYPDIIVTTKEKLLSHSPSLLAQLNTLTSDQQAIVDFEVLSRADMYAGMHRSSFDWQLAFRKHIYSEMSRDQCLHREPHMFEDEFGHILNAEPDKWYDFFFYTTWP